MSKSRPHRVFAVLLAGTVLVLASCTRPDDTGSGDDTSAAESDATTGTSPGTDGTAGTRATTASTEPVVDSTTTTSAPADASTVAPASTAPASSSAAPTTEAPTPADASDLVLAFDGVLPFRFGRRDVEVVSALTDLLGAPESDDVALYPVAAEGFFFDENEQVSFVSPVGRTVCFVNDLCVDFGSGTESTLIFTGWSVTSARPPLLATETGVTVGASWGDHQGTIAADEGGCFDVGYGDSDGIDVTMESSGEPFVSFDGNGDPVFGEPDPADVTITQLDAGEQPAFVLADC